MTERSNDDDVWTYERPTVFDSVATWRKYLMQLREDAKRHADEITDAEAELQDFVGIKRD